MKIDRAQNQKSCSGRAAFTLVEVLIGVLGTAVMFASLYLGLGQGFAIIQAARENLRATQIMQERMETIRLYTWDQLNTSGFIPATFTAPFEAASTQSTGGLVYSGTITIAAAPMSESYAGDHKLVTVGLNWESGKTAPHRREMSTIVSRYGLHNYYY
jgi:hypothetical protein